MKTKYWIILFVAVALALAGLSLLLIPKGAAASVEVWSEGKLLHTLDLNVDTTVEIKCENGTNTVVVEDGRAWVSHADCPDRSCVDQGKRSSGQIVCLPNRLVLKFTGEEPIDGISG